VYHVYAAIILKFSADAAEKDGGFQPLIAPDQRININQHTEDLLA